MLNDGVRPNGATNDPRIIRKWNPSCNIGIAPHASRMTFIDVDVKPGKVGEATFMALVAKHGVFQTFTVITPSGGRHYWFYETIDVQHAFGVNRFGCDVDCPQYAIVPGSVVDNRFYAPLDIKWPITDAPLWLAEYQAAKPSIGHNSRAPAVEQDTDAIIERAIFYLRNDAKPSIQFRNGEVTLLMVAASSRTWASAKRWPSTCWLNTTMSPASAIRCGTSATARRPIGLISKSTMLGRI